MNPSAPPSTIAELVNLFLSIIGYAIPALFAVVFIFIVWKVIDAWIINGGDESKVSEGKTYVVVGVIAFVVMLSAWGMVYMLRSTFFGF